MKKYFCDKCGVELKTDSDRDTIQFFDHSGHNPLSPYAKKDVCSICAKLIFRMLKKE